MSATIVIVYSPILYNDFLNNWDDQWMVTGNPYLNELNWSGIYSIFVEHYQSQYSPINTIAYLVTKELAGMKPFGFHLLSLIIHILNFLLVGVFIEKLLPLIKGVVLEKQACYWVAWGTAFLFALHPMQVEAVAWISASKVLLYSFFYLAGLLTYLYYLETEKERYYFATLVLFLCSLLSKEQAIVFFLSLLAIDLATHTTVKNKKLWLGKMPFVVTAIVFGFFTIWVQKIYSSGPLGMDALYPLYQRVVFANYSFWEYIIKLLTPHSLSHIYFFPMDGGELLPLRLWFYPMATAVFIWLLIEYRRYINRVHVFGGLFFFINIALVLHVIPISRRWVIADRYIYLSSIGFFLIGTYTFIPWLTSNRSGKTKKSIIITALSICVLIWAGYTHQRTKVWKNMETLNEDVKETVEKHIESNYIKKFKTGRIINDSISRDVN